MRRSAVLAWLTLAVACLAPPAAVSAQGHPGDIPQPGTYEGSMELQRREQEAQDAQRAQEAQRREQEEQQWQQATESTAWSAPAGSDGGGGGGGAPQAPAVDWWSKPALPAAQNRLLGRWQQVAAREVSSQDVSGPYAALLGPGATDAVAALLNGTFAGGCQEMFGRGVIAFNPSSLDWVAPDGHEEILNHVEYRADGARVVVLSRDPGAVPALAFGFPSEDVAVAAGFNCTMNRVGSTTAASTASPTGVHSRLGPLGAAPAGPPNATLSVLAGVSAPGMLTPFENATLYLTTEDPAAALARAGFGGTNPYADWLAACRQKRDGCMAGMNAMTSSSVGTIQLDAAGKGQTPALPSGQYFVLGFAPYQGRSLIWHRPYFLRPGANNLILDQTDGTSG